MAYEFTAIAEVPRAGDAAYQHVLDTYASEINKVVSTWRGFVDGDLSYKPHAKSASVLEILRHELLSERRFFGEFLGRPEPPADRVLPAAETVATFCDRLAEMAAPRLVYLAGRD